MNGRITSGIAVDAASQKVVDFVERHLSAWRDDPNRSPVQAERELNAQLCKFLNVAANRDDFSMVHFHNEEPQGSQHAADLSANPTDSNWIEGRQYTKYDPIVVFEGKRLPTPGRARQREYVASPHGQRPAGGIQRFKLGLHGAGLARAGMIAYVQARSCAEWFTDVNQWIDDLVATGDPLWTTADRLRDFRPNHSGRVSKSDSEHVRSSGTSPPIVLTHLWVEM